MSMADRLIEALGRASTRVYEPGAEAVSQLEHALQCADLAETAGADDDLVLACLLHDVGRFAADRERRRPARVGITTSAPI
jgi:predicted HD phosphohydrolase